MIEYDKYQDIQLKTQDLQAQWENQMKEMQISKEKILAELIDHFEAKLKDKQIEIDRVVPNFFLVKYYFNSLKVK